MGECAYYLKACFPNVKTAKTARSKLQSFIEQSRKAYEFYQKNRDPKTPKTFWKKVSFWMKFEKNFPLVFDYVKTLPEYVKGTRDASVLTGMLDFGQDGNDVYIEGTVIEYSDGMVWHMADWGPLCEYVQKQYGAVKVVCDTEEGGCGSLESLQLYDYAGIVNKILEHPETFALLMGIHDDLDAMIDLKTKKKKA